MEIILARRKYPMSSKVNSNTGIFLQCNQLLAKPHKVAIRPEHKPAGDYRTEYAAQFGKRVVTHAAMSKKPLVPYHPNAYRSRILQHENENINSNRNASQVKFDQGLLVMEKRRFKTTNQLSYTGEPVDRRENQGIQAHETKLRHFEMSK
jgi:hypothetical protein